MSNPEECCRHEHLVLDELSSVWIRHQLVLDGLCMYDQEPELQWESEQVHEREIYCLDCGQRWGAEWDMTAEAWRLPPELTRVP